MSVRTIHRCPYCGRGLAIDIAALFAWLRAHPGEFYLDIIGPTPPDVFVFDPHSPDQKACSHLISACIIGQDFFGPEARGLEDREVSISWDHPWFEQHDPDTASHKYMWDLVGNTSMQDDGPITDYVTPDPSKILRTKEGLSGVDCGGFLVYALHPQEFFASLQHELCQ
jgi:hypothetical protein